MSRWHSMEITSKIKEIIGGVAGLDPRRIADDAALREDLNLDSLSLLEIGVDVDLAFALGLPDDAYREVETLPGMTALVARRLEELGAAGAPGAAHEVGAAGAAAQDRLQEVDAKSEARG